MLVLLTACGGGGGGASASGSSGGTTEPNDDLNQSEKDGNQTVLNFASFDGSTFEVAVFATEAEEATSEASTYR